MNQHSSGRSMAIIVPVWGQAFVETYLNWCLPSQLTCGNIPVLAGTNSSLEIYTTEEDRRLLEGHPSILKAAEYLRVCIHVMEKNLDLKHKFEAAQACYRLGMRHAAEHGVDWVAIVNPDAFFVGPVYNNQETLLRQNKRALLCLGVRLDKDQFLGRLGALSPASRVLPEALIEQALESLHPVSRSLDVRAQCSNIWPSHLYFTQSGVLVGKGFHLHPMIVAMGEGADKFEGMPDVSLTDSLGIRDDEILYATDSETGFAFELSEGKHDITSTITNAPFSPFKVAKWQTRHCTDSQRKNFEHTFFLYPFSRRSEVRAVVENAAKIFTHVAKVIEHVNAAGKAAANEQAKPNSASTGRLPALQLVRNLCRSVLGSRRPIARHLVRMFWRDTLVMLTGRARLVDWKSLGDVSTGFQRHELALECHRRALAQDLTSATAHFQVAAALMELGRYEESLLFYSETIAISPEWFGAYEVYGRCLWICGQWKRAREVWKEGLKEQDKQAKLQSLGNADYRILNEVWSGWLGNNAHLDAYIKIRTLGWHEPHRILMLAPSGKVANRCYMNYWKKYVEIVEDAEDLQRYSREAPYLGDSLYAMFIRGEPHFYAHAIALTHREWEQQARPPLLSLDAEHRTRGHESLKRLGIPENAWFVCIHVRESGFWKETHDPTNKTRVANIFDYVPAIRLIVENGGCVVRMGDASMTPLPAMRGVVDYALSAEKSDWMDVFLCAACRFLIGTNSALYHVTMSFGVPSVLTNWMPLTSNPMQSRDLFIPKLVYSRKDRRHLSFEETMRLPRDIWTGNYFSNQELEPVDNDDVQITDVVREMLFEIRDEDGEALQLRYRTLAEAHQIYGLARMGAGFLKQYRHLLS